MITKRRYDFAHKISDIIGNEFLRCHNRYYTVFLLKFRDRIHNLILPELKGRKCCYLKKIKGIVGYVVCD